MSTTYVLLNADRIVIAASAVTAENTHADALNFVEGEMQAGDMVVVTRNPVRLGSVWGQHG